MSTHVLSWVYIGVILSLHVHPRVYIGVTLSLHITRGRNSIYPLGLVTNNVPGMLFVPQSCTIRVSTPGARGCTLLYPGWDRYYVLSHLRSVVWSTLFYFLGSKNQKKTQKTSAKNGTNETNREEEQWGEVSPYVVEHSTRETYPGFTGRGEETTSIPSWYRRPQGNPTVPKVHPVVDPETSLPTSRSRGSSEYQFRSSFSEYRDPGFTRGRGGLLGTYVWKRQFVRDSRGSCDDPT